MRYIDGLAGVPLTLLALAGCGQPPAPPRPAVAAAADPASETVRIAMNEFRFTPQMLTLKAGQPYRLVLVNEGSGKHDLTAPAFFRAARAAPAPEGGTIVLAPGESATIDIRPETAGTYDTTCSMFLHSLFGMDGAIKVE
jgi:uncharacterized cupredoxin-like copper-binding protein